MSDIIEAEWNSCTDPQVMLDFLRTTGKLSERKARLFAVRCCQRLLGLFPNEVIRRAVALGEKDVDQEASCSSFAPVSQHGKLGPSS